MGGQIRIEKDGALGWVVFDHPERRNAITAEMWSGIPDAVDELAADPDIRVAILRGAGDVAFVSGADISEFNQRRTGGSALDYEERNARAYAALADFPKPALAMIHGFCVGGGLNIAIHVDLRFAADDAVFAVPAARLGLGYPPSALTTLAGLVGGASARDLLFTARRIEAEEALRIGLVNAVLPKAELDSRVADLAAQIARGAPLTLRSAKLVLRQWAGGPGASDPGAVRASLQECFASEDYREGVRAFLEKRAPRFQGK